MSPPQQTTSTPDPSGHEDGTTKLQPEEVIMASEAPGKVEDTVPAADEVSADLSTEEKPQEIEESKADEPLVETQEHKTEPAAPVAVEEGKQPELVVPVSEPAEHLTASTATLKPATTPPPLEPQQNLLSADSQSYVDPTPPTPVSSQPPSRTPSTAPRSHRPDEPSPSRHESDVEDKAIASEDEQEGGSTSEIQSIMSQFSDFGGPGAEEVMSPRLEVASPTLGTGVQHPPRKSSLEPLAPNIASQIQELQALQISAPSASGASDARKEEQAPPVPPKDGFFATPPRRKDDAEDDIGSPASPGPSKHRPPPPEPEPEPALPFDFHRFLEQLRNKKADPVARYLKSFLQEFGKKQWMVHEQVKIISDFLAFIANKMLQCEVWRDDSDAEFDNAREGMEKLVMNRLYAQTFSPAIPPPRPIPGAKPKRRGGELPLGPGRRGQHQEDVERDDILAQKINIYGWVREEHLDIPPVGDGGRRFLKLAQQELLKIKSYRAPRDKIICVLNCCKVIFGLLKHNKSDSSADSFVPLLIYVVLQCNPEHLVSNVQYILRFRNQDKLGGEAGYYLSSLMGVIQFVESMDRTTLTISDEEFEKNVEAAVSSIAEKQSPRTTQQQTFNEKAAYAQGSSSSRPSLDGAGGGPHSRATSQGGNDPAITGLLRTFQKPLSTIGRMFTDEGEQAGPSESNAAPPPSYAQPSAPPPAATEDTADLQRKSSRHTLSAEEAAARQASAEAEEAHRLQRAEHANVVETLSGMFPDLDKDVISDVVHQKEGRVGLAVDACLALST